MLFLTLFPGDDFKDIKKADTIHGGIFYKKIPLFHAQ